MNMYVLLTDEGAVESHVMPIGAVQMSIELANPGDEFTVKVLDMTDEQFEALPTDDEAAS